MQRNILEYLESTRRRVPDKIAFADEEQTLTFDALYTQARGVGTALCRDGLCRQPVVVLMRRQSVTIAAFLGIVYAGCFYVPLDPEMPRLRVETILRNLQPAACVCEEATLKQAEELENIGKIYRYEDISATVAEDGALAAVRAEQLDTDPVYVVFTSGSTGTPKGVVGCHRAVIDYIENLCPVLGFDENTVFGNQTPLYFDACLKEILPTLKFGATTWLIPKKLFLFPVTLVEYLNRRKINTLCWVVSALTYISAFQTFEKVKPLHLRTVAFASEVFPIRQLKLWREALPRTRFINLYGPTETTGICCYYEVDRDFAEDETLPIGRPFPNTQILLLDGNNRVPPPGEQGEICVRGTRLTLGYYGSKAPGGFVQNPLNPHYRDPIYRTGDMGRYNSRGELVFVSRKDHQIKRMGHRIELGEIEAAANADATVRSSCCVFDPAQGRLTLYYVGEITEGALRQTLKEKLPRYMLPQSLHRMDRMPLTPNGKIDRNSLKNRSEEHG